MRQRTIIAIALIVLGLWNAMTAISAFTFGGDGSILVPLLLASSVVALLAGIFLVVHHRRD